MHNVITPLTIQKVCVKHHFVCLFVYFKLIMFQIYFCDVGNKYSLLE